MSEGPIPAEDRETKTSASTRILGPLCIIQSLRHVVIWKDETSVLTTWVLPRIGMSLHPIEALTIWVSLLGWYQLEP